MLWGGRWTTPSSEGLSNLRNPVILHMHLKLYPTTFFFFFKFLAHLNPINRFLPFLMLQLMNWLLRLPVEPGKLSRLILSPRASLSVLNRSPGAELGAETPTSHGHTCLVRCAWVWRCLGHVHMPLSVVKSLLRCSRLSGISTENPEASQKTPKTHGETIVTT